MTTQRGIGWLAVMACLSLLLALAHPAVTRADDGTPAAGATAQSGDGSGAAAGAGTLQTADTVANPTTNNATDNASTGGGQPATGGQTDTNTSAGAADSRTARSGRSQSWLTIQIGPDSSMVRSRRWRRPHSSQVMVIRIGRRPVSGLCCVLCRPRGRCQLPEQRRRKVEKGG